MICSAFTMSSFGPEAISTQTKRLHNRMVQRGGAAVPGMSASGGIFFGGVFLIVGTLIALAGLKVIPIDPKGLHVPYGVLATVGLVFALPGLMILGQAARNAFAARRRERLQGFQAAEPAILDYPWNRDRWTPDRWAAVRRAGFAAGFLTIFMAVTGYIVFFESGAPFIMKLGMGVFMLVAAWCWVMFFRAVGHALKYGESWIGYRTFPMRPGTTLTLAWQPPARLLAVSAGGFTLRCVREWTETKRHGSRRRIEVVHEEVWSSSREVSPGTLFRPAEQTEVTFTLSADLPGTCLSAAQTATYWELEIQLDVPGLDFKETYLVPIYTA